MNKQEELFSKSDVVKLPIGIVDVPEPFQHFDKFNIKNGNDEVAKDKIRILAIDQASNCGWATKHAHGVWDFNTRKDESSGMKMLRFRAKLREVCSLEDITLIVYERVAGFHKAAIIHAAKMVAIIESFCEENKIDYKAVSATEVKKLATGKGNANKDKMIEAATLKLGYTGKNDNEADALWIYQLVKQELGL